MSASVPSAPARPSFAAHLKRAFGWNLGWIVPAPSEVAALSAAGLTDPAVQRYAAWRRSVMIVAAVPTLAVLVLAAFDTFDSDLGELTVLGMALEAVVVLATAALPAACLYGAWSWTRPGASARWLRGAWVVAFLLPFVYALLPAGAIFHVQPLETGASLLSQLPEPLGASDAAKAVIEAAKSDKLASLHQMAIEFVLSGGAYLLLLPAVLSLIPGAVNGCLRIKALLPAAQLPGWLLVCAAPAFLLFWLVILVVANHAARSPLLVLGVLLWAGSPIVYSLRAPVFVRSQIAEADAARIVRVKRAVGLLALAGVALMLAFVASAKVAGLRVVGADREAAMSTKMEELASKDDEVSLGDVQEAFRDSESLVYAFDLSSWRMIVDVLAKLLLVTAVFADLILRATLSAWRNDRSLRAGPGATAYDASAAAVLAALSPAARPA